MAKKRFLLVRHPSTPEEEGRITTFGPFKTKKVAKTYRDKAKEEGNGYFRNVGWDIYKRIKRDG